LHGTPHLVNSRAQLLSRNVNRFRGGLVFKAHRLVYHSTLGLRVIKKKKTLAGTRVGRAGQRTVCTRASREGDMPPTAFERIWHILVGRAEGETEKGREGERERGREGERARKRDGERERESEATHRMHLVRVRFRVTRTLEARVQPRIEYLPIARQAPPQQSRPTVSASSKIGSPAGTGLPFPRRWGCSHLPLLSLRTCSV